MGLTIREIAARAGVSAATVSRVVNGTGAVAPEKREQVLAVLGEQQAAPRRRRSANAAGKTLGVLMLPGSESDPRVIVNKLSAITENCRANGVCNCSLPKSCRWSWRRATCAANWPG